MIKRLLLVIIICLISISDLFPNTQKLPIDINVLDNCVKVSDHYYQIIGNIDLKKQELELPSSIVISFIAGKISNGIVVFNNTKLINPNFDNCRFRGSVVDAIFNVTDFGVKPNIQMDCSVVINDLIRLKTYPTTNNNPKHIYFAKGTYYIDQPIELFAGFESPITLSGEGNMSNICQRSNNEYIIKVYEQNHIKNLMLSYKKQQTINDSRSVAIACQRSIFSIFENISIRKAHTAFGYIALNDQKTGYNPTGYHDQCYVSDNFRNIRIYEFSGYALDFKKEFPQGDSGSAYDNIYICNGQWLGNYNENSSRGAIRGDNTVASFTHINIEGANYSSTLIELLGFSRISIQSLHIEGLNNTPMIARVTVQSMLHADQIDLQFCKFPTDTYYMFGTNDNGLISVNGLGIRPDCVFEKSGIYKMKKGVVEGLNSITINNIIDGTRTVWK